MVTKHFRMGKLWLDEHAKLYGRSDDQEAIKSAASALKADAAAVAGQAAAGQLDALDKAHRLTAKLEALLSMACGDAGHLLRTMDPALQDAYMWACSDMATELKGCLGALEAP